MKKLIPFFVLSFTFYVISLPAFAAFSDVPQSYPNREAIEFVQSKGIVSGYPDGTYQPDRRINRAEFTKIVVGARFRTIEIENCIATEGFYKQKLFSDVDNGIWFEKFICVAKKNKIIEGYPDGTFKPTQTINFAEAAKIVVNSYGLAVGTGADWYTPFLSKLAALDAVPDSITQLASEIDKALKEVIRGEMAAVIFGMKDQDDTVFSEDSVPDDGTPEDSSMSIKIPELALPAGFDRSTLIVRKMRNDDCGKEIAEIYGSPIVCFKLEPDGLRFLQPVTFSVEVPTSKNTIPIVFLVHGDSFDIVQKPLVEINQAVGRANISAELDGFSILAVADLPLFKLTTNVVPDQSIGELFHRTATVEKNKTPNTFVNLANTTSIQILDDWTINSGLYQAIRGDLDPSLVVDVPSIELFSGPALFSTTEYFKCLSPGEALSKYHFTLGFTYIRKYGNTTDINQATLVVDESGYPFDCVQ